MATMNQAEGLSVYEATIREAGVADAKLAVRCLGGNVRDEHGTVTIIDPSDVPFRLTLLRPRTYAIDVAIDRRWVRLSIEVTLSPRQSE